MKRRQVLKGIGATSVAGLAVGSASARRPNFEVNEADLDLLKVVRDGEVVETFDDPTMDDVARIRSGLEKNEELVNDDDCCVVECHSDCCPNRCCMYGGYC